MTMEFYLNRVIVRVIVLFVFCLFAVAVANAQSCGCTYTVPTTATVVDNNVLGLAPGSTICLQGTYINGLKHTLEFRNFQSTNASQRFIFKNCGGQAIVKSTNTTAGASAIFFNNCKNFRVTGTGHTGVEYGILVDGDLSGTVYAPEWGLTCGGKSTDFEIDHVKVTQVQFAAFGLKTDPGCGDPSAWRGSFTMRNVSVHENFVDFTNRGEGFYIGYTGYSTPITCGTTTGYGHTIQGLRVFKNKTYNTGSEGIQVGSANADVQIYDNHIENYGQRPHNNDLNGQGNGLQLGDGTTGSCYNNFIKANAGPKGGAIKVFGINNVVYNNILVDSYGSAIFADERPGSDTGPGSGYKFYNNVIINPVNDASIVLYTDLVENNWVKNNILVRSGGGQFFRFLSSSVPIDSTKNFRTTNISYVKFVNPAADDYRLAAGSPCINNGVNLYSEGVTIDFAHNPRPSTGAFEQGVYEYGSIDDGFELFINAGGDTYNEEENGEVKEWEADLACSTCTPHPTLDTSYPSYGTGSTAAFGGPNTTSAPSQVLGTYRYTLNTGTTIRYAIPVPSNGLYNIELFFARKNADTFVSGDRRFNIIIEGQTVTTYDVYDEGGTGGTAASSYPYVAQVTDGVLEIKFVAVAGAHSMINAIWVKLQETENMSLFINSGGDQFVDGTTTWEADQGGTGTPHPTLDTSFPTYTTGSTAAFGGANATSAPREVLGTYRYTLNTGTTIRYAIPVPQSGTYDIELFFARKNADTFVSGGRRFNIIIEGQTVTTYDVYDQGGTNGTAASSFPYSASVTDGVLEIKFVAVAGSHAMINAITVQGPVQSGSFMQEQTASMSMVSAEEESAPNAVYPNPTSDELKITFERDDVYQVKVLTAGNELYLTRVLEGKKGESQTFDVSGISDSQMFIILIQSSKGVKTYKVFKGRN